MKTKHLLLVGMVVVLASCSTSYRNGQTPDDVYYSPVPAGESYVVKSNKNDRNSYSYRNADNLDYGQEREIRRAIRDSRYRSSISLNMGYGGYNSFGYNPYSYNPYGYNSFGNNYFGYNPYYGKGFNDPFGYNPYYNNNPYYSHNSYYPSYGFNPGYGNYYPHVNYYPVPGKTSNNRGARQYNLGSYSPTPSTPRGINSTKSGMFRPAPTAPVRSFNNRISPVAPLRKEKTGAGNVIRRVFTPSENRSNTPPATNRRSERSNTPPVRTFDPPTRRSQPPVRSESTPPVRNNTPPVRSNNNPPVRTFDPSPAVSTPAPSASSSSTPAKESGSTPVRTFRNN